MKILILNVRAAIRFMTTAGPSTEHHGDCKFVVEPSPNGNGKDISIRWSNGQLNFSIDSRWSFTAHKLKSKNSKGRVILISLEDGSRIQISTKIQDIFDHGKVLVTFFERYFEESAARFEEQKPDPIGAKSDLGSK